MKRSRLSRKHPHYVTKYFDVTPHSYPFTVRVIARTKRHARRLFKTLMKKDYEWTPQEWKEFVEHNYRLGKVERFVSPKERKA
jgi:hypothetical protein